MKPKTRPYIFLTALTLFAVWFFSGRFGLFASNGDWLSQHSVIPEQFRQQFYATGQLFPEFAAGLGAGQNIYNFSYYGLFSPILLPSYLLPFLKMSDYLIAVCLVCLTTSVLLFYYWLGTHGFSIQVKLPVTILFLLAAPMVYQFHRQIMFVNYMPFLCISLIGADRYRKKGKPGLYIAGVFLMIMTSFYFSIAGLFALCLYIIGQCEKTNQRNRIFRFILPTAAALCMAGFLLIPTAYALFTRSAHPSEISFASLFLPDFSYERFAYSGYGIGLTAGILASLFLCIACKSLGERFLSAACLVVITIPFFSWALNGGLYARGKSLIPFLPVFCYLAASCLTGINTRKISGRMCLAGYLAAAAFCAGSFAACAQKTLAKPYTLMFAELLLLPVCFMLFRRTRRLSLIIAPSVCCLVCCGVYLNETDILDTDFYENVTAPSWQEVISDVLQKESGLFRLEQSGSHEEKKANINRTWDSKQWSVSSYSSAYQESYKNFREKTFQTEQPLRNCLMQSVSDNPLFQKFMGIKYMVAKNSGSNRSKPFSVSTQNYAAPVIYATDQVITEHVYRKMQFPYNQTTLMRYAVAEEGKGLSKQQITASVPNIRQTDIVLLESGSAKKTDGGYQIKTDQKTKTTLFVSGEDADFTREQIFFLQFDVKNHQKNRDVIIELAGVRNNLSAQDHVYYNGNTTFTYAIKLKKGQRKIDFLLGTGSYSILNIKSYLEDAAILAEDSLYQSAFVPDWSLTRGNRICGTINVQHKGYLITSIPFDRGFEIRINGRRINTEPVNTAFLGAQIPKGEHRIEIVYHAPGIFMGRFFSGIGFLLWILAEIAENREKIGLTVSIPVLYSRKSRI